MRSDSERFSSHASAVPNGFVEQKQLGYRERIYSRYVSAFKGRRSSDRSQVALGRQGSFFDYLFAPLFAAGKPKSVLDVGCGAGTFLHWAVQKGIPTVHGFDLSAEQVECARILGLPAEVADYKTYLPKAAQKYDLVVALDVIEHLTRDEAFEFLDLCQQALAPGGRLFLTTPNGAGFRPGPIIYGDLTHETIFSPQTIQLALQLTGFESVKVREIVPPIRSLKSGVRRLLWALLRFGPLLLDLVEKGSQATFVYSRVMAIEAHKSSRLAEIP